MNIVSRPVIHILAIIIFVTLSYFHTLDVPFQLDDIGNIVSSPAIKTFDYFTNPGKLESPGNTDVFDKPLFRTRYFGYLTFAINYAVHGLDTRGYHLVNILIHLCTALLLYRLIILTFSTPRMAATGAGAPCSTNTRNFIAFFTTLLFAVHPIQTQAVTYIVQRFASLATMLWLLSMVSYLQFRLSSGPSSSFVKRTSMYGLTLVSAVLAMKTKEFALLLPLVIVMYEFMFFESGLKKRFLYLIPLCLTMITVPLSLMDSASRGLAESSAKISGALNGISRVDYLFTQFRVIVTYIRLLLFPVNQRFDYDYPIYRSFFSPEVAISFLFLLTIFLTGVYLLRISRLPNKINVHLYRLIAFGIFWFFITISAESSVIPIADVIFEHRLYLPSIGFFIALVSTFELLRLKWSEGVSSILTMSVYAMLLLAAGLSAATYMRNSQWRDRFDFLEDEVKKSPAKARPRNLLGSMYGEQGKMDKAIYHLKKAIADNPGYGGAHYSLGITYMRMGRLEEAAYEYEQTIALKFDYAEAHANLGVVYANQGRWNEAVREYSTAIAFSPQSHETYNNLGNAYNKLGLIENAVNEYLTAIRLKPDFAEAHYNLGNTYATLNRPEEAKKEYRTALRFRPDFVEARWQLEK